MKLGPLEFMHELSITQGVLDIALEQAEAAVSAG